QWRVYEDQSRRDGVITFVSNTGALRLPKRPEAVFDDIKPSYLGLALKDICLADADLLADKLLAHGGDPDPEEVRRAAPPAGWNFTRESLWWRMPWTTFIGTKQQGDTMPIFPNGRTRAFRPEHEFPELNGDDNVKTRWEGLLGGWLPAVHKIIEFSPTRHYDLLVFADVTATDKLVVQTWHRTIQYDNGKAVKTTFGHSYAPFPPRRVAPTPEAFYEGLLTFAGYWQNELKDQSALSLPDAALSDMVSHAFAKELMTRPGGVYPKYGVVDRDYFGSEYDGFQDTFTSSLYANLEWGRFDQAKAVLVNYFEDFVFDDGQINMRGPEVAQFGLTLSLLARYLRYTGDVATLKRFTGKIENTAAILSELHDLALKKPAGDAGFGLLDGWSESDACLHPDPSVWWKPYWNNSAFTVRGWRDIAAVWPVIAPDRAGLSADWTRRADALQTQLVSSLRANILSERKPPYIAILPGVTQTHREALVEARKEKKSSDQGWAHRVYAELLHADVLPDDLAQTVIDAVRGHGGTAIGVLANFGPANERSRDQLGFISYGYAQQLLRSDRIEEYLLFLHSHRYHSHTPGTWVAGEVTGITGGLPLFCIPAQLTIPKLVRWALVFEASDADTLYLGRAVARDWVASGQRVAIKAAPTRWGPVDFSLQRKGVVITAEAVFSGQTLPQQVRLRLRVPKGQALASVRLDGRTVKPEGEDIVFTPKAGRVTIEARLKAA
ncbi:MAG: Tat pathway signal protein, partial [Asticcacaulis sp.]